MGATEGGRVREFANQNLHVSCVETGVDRVVCSLSCIYLYLAEGGSGETCFFFLFFIDRIRLLTRCCLYVVCL